MSECVCLAVCPFFHDRLENMPHAAQVLKSRYCLTCWQECARHRVFESLGMEAVPSDLFPDMDEEAEKILNGDRRLRAL